MPVGKIEGNYQSFLLKPITKNNYLQRKMVKRYVRNSIILLTEYLSKRFRQCGRKTGMRPKHF